VSYNESVRIAALASALALVAFVAACTPAEATSGVVVSKVESGQALVKNSDDFAPEMSFTCGATAVRAGDRTVAATTGPGTAS
jgi:hypothetical protein